MSDSSSILGILERARDRRTAQLLIAWGVRWLLSVGVGALVYERLLAPSGRPLTTAGAAGVSIAVAAGLVLLLAPTFRRRRSLADTARFIDKRLDLEQRLETAAEHFESTDDFARLLEQDAHRRLDAVKLSQLIPITTGLDLRIAVAAGVLVGSAVLVPAWSGHPQGLGLLGSVTRSAAFGSQAAVTETPPAAVDVSPAGSTEATGSDLSSPQDRSVGQAPDSPGTGDTQLAPLSGGAGEPDRAEPREVQSESPKSGEIFDQMLLAATTTGAVDPDSSGDSEGAPADSPVAASGGNDTRPPSAPSEVSVGTEPGEVEAMLEAAFARHEIPLRLRKYVRDYLVAVATLR